MVNDHSFSYKNQMGSKLKKVLFFYLLLNQIFALQLQFFFSTVPTPDFILESKELLYLWETNS